MSSPDRLTELESLRSQVGELSRTLAERDQSIRGLREQSDLLRAIVEGTATDTGAEFLRSLVKHLAQALHVQYAFVGTWRPEAPDSVCTLAIWSGTDFTEPFEYGLQHTPCANVIGQRLCLHESGVQQLFPDDRLLAQLEVDSYCGMPLFDRSGQPLGLLVVMDNRPMTRGPLAKDLLRIFAARAATELQRQQVEITVREQERWLRLKRFPLDHTADAVLWADDSTRFIYANDAACRSLGYSNEELLTLSIPDVTPHHDPVRFRLPLAQMNQGTPVICESVHRRKDGTEFPVEVSFTCLEHDGRGYTCCIVRNIAERKQIEQERLQALHDLRNIMETVPDFMFTLDLQGNMVKWNRRVEEVTGYGPEELLNMPALAFVPPEATASTAAAIHRAFTEGYAELDGELLTKDGRLIPYHWTGALLKNLHGEPIGITGIGRDVTDQKRTEAALKLERQHLVEAQALAHLGSWDWNIDTGEVTWSDEQFRIFGHEPGAIAVTYDTFLASLHPDDHDRILTALNDALLGNRPYDVDCRIVGPNGEIRFIHVRGDVHRSTAGHPLSMAGTALDITERKQAEETLRASEERWQLAVQGSNDGIWDWNIQTGDVFFSLRWKALRGFADHEITNHVDEWQSRIHPDDLDRVLQRIEAYLAKQTPEFSEEYRVQRKDGSYMWVLDRGVALWADNGTPLRMAGSESDITARKRAEESLQESEGRYRLLTQSTFDGIAIHDRGILIEANSGLEKMFGYEPGELIGKHVLDLVADESREMVIANMHAGVSGPYESLGRRKDGSTFYGEVVVKTYYYNGREVRLVAGRDINDRKRMEQALRVSEQHFALATAGSHDALWDAHPIPGEPWYAPQTQIWWSPRIREWLRLDESEPFETLEHWASRLHPEDKDRIFGALTAHIEQRVPYDAEYRLRTNRGDYRWIRGRGQALWDEQGRPRRMSGSCQDITDRKRAEEAQQASDERFNFVIDATSDGIWDWDLHTGTVYFSPQWIRLLGYSPEEVLPSAEFFFSILHPEDKARTAQALQEHLEGRTAVKEIEVRLRHKSGDYRWFLDRGKVVVKNQDGGPARMVGTITDITDRKQMERALRESEERFDLAVRGSNTGIWDWDIRTNKSYFSPLWKSMLGYDEHELLGEFSEWENRLHPDDRERALATVRAYLEGMTPQYQLEHRLRHKDGTYRWILARGVSISDAEGVPYRMAGAHVDITEQKQTQDALAASERQLRTVLDALPVGVWFTDPSGKPLLANPAAKQIWSGIKQVGMENTPSASRWWEMFGPSSVLHRWALGRVLTTGRPSLNETLALECLDGTKKTIRNTAVPVQDEAGAVLGAIVLNEDITALRHMQETIKLTQFSVDHAVEAFFWIGPDAGILHVNEAACHMLEYTRDELTSMTVHDIDPNFPQEIWTDHWEELKQKGSMTFESKHWSRTGRVLDTEVTINYLQYEGKEYNCAIMRDIGERKRADAALRASEERYRALYDGTPTMYFTLTTDGTVRSVNRYGAEQLGYQTQELIGHSVLGLFHEDDKEAVSTSLSECFATPEVTRHWEFRKVRKDGDIVWVRETARIGQSSSGETILLVTCEDITAQKLAEAQQARQYDQLQAIFRMALTLSHTTSLDDIYREAIDCMRGALKADRAAILLLDEAGVMRFRASQGLSKQYQSAVEGHSPWTRETISPQPILIDDITSDSSVDRYQEIFRAEGFSALGFIPLILPEGLQGKFMLYYDQPHSFTVEEVGVAQTIAGHIAYMIQRSRADQSLRVSEERYRSLVDNAPIGIFVNEAGRFTYVNREMQRILHATGPEQLLGRPVLDRIAPEFHQAVKERIQQLTEHDQPVPPLDEEYICLDGSRVEVSVTAIPTTFNGTPAMQVLVLDITERKKAEEALREKHTLLSAIMDATMDIVFVKDLQGRYLHMNPSGARAVGLSVEEVVGKDDHAIWPADLAACCQEADRKILASGAAQTMEESTTVDGQRITYLTTKAPYRDATGRMIGIIGVAHDISQIKRSEEELRRSHAFLRQVIDVDPNFVFAKDRAGRFTLVNKAIAQAYGTTVENLIGKTDADFNVNPEQVTFFREKDVQVMDSLQDLFIPEEAITDSMGNRRWLQTVKRPILDEQGRALMVLGAATDITERKRMEEALRQRERDLRTAIEERERISQDLHDGILQSLFAVGLTLETTKSMMSLKERKTSGPALDQAIDQLNRLMHEVRNFIAGLGSDLLQGKDLPTALHHMLATLANNRPTRVRLKVEDRAAQALSAEQSLQLLLVIQEAVSNCIRHGHAQEATVSLKMLKQGVRLSVRDNGCGFNLQAAKGTGHGLSNMAARAQKIGGRFTILSNVNGGTRIVLDVPMEASLAHR